MISTFLKLILHRIAHFQSPQCPESLSTRSIGGLAVSVELGPRLRDSKSHEMELALVRFVVVLFLLALDWPFRVLTFCFDIFGVKGGDQCFWRFIIFWGA